MITEKEILQFERTYGDQLISKENGRVIIKSGVYFYDISESCKNRYKKCFSNMTADSKIRYLNDERIKSLHVRATGIDGDNVIIENKSTKSVIRQNIFKILHGDDCVRQIIHLTEKEQKGLDKVKLKLGDWYSYDNAIYSGSHNKMAITCPEHGDFNVTPANVLFRNVGCPKCSFEKKSFGKSGFVRYCKINNGGVGNLYVLKLSNDSELFYKIGITSKPVKVRIKSIPYQCDVILNLVGDSSDIYNLEKILHREFYSEKYIPNLEFNGMHECFSFVDIDKINEIGAANLR